MLHARRGLRGLEVQLAEAPAVRGRDDVHRVEHAGQAGVDAEERLAPQHPRAIDAGDRFADDRERFGLLESEGRGIGRGELRGVGRHLAVADRASACAMEDAAPRRGELAHRHRPARGRRLQQHGARAGARLAHRQPVGRRGGAAARNLPAVARGIGIGLRDAHLAPVAIEFIGDDHRQRGLHALPDLGILRGDRHETIGRDRDEGGEFRRGRGGRLGPAGRTGREPPTRPPRNGREKHLEREAASREQRPLQETATFRLHGRPPAARGPPPCGSRSRCGGSRRSGRCCPPSRRECPRSRASASWRAGTRRS